MTYKTIDLNTNQEIVYTANTIIALGDFDGVHIAHEKILSTAVRLARRAHAVPAVWTFETLAHKEAGREKGVLTTCEEKLARIKSSGIQIAFVADFDSFRQLTPEAFIEWLKKELHCTGVVCGFNFTFGCGKTGTPALLEKAFDYIQVEEEMILDSVTVSSSVIRQLLSEGRPETAAHFLGRPYEVTGAVVHGNELGRGFGFPTANVSMPICKMLPKPGVYQTEVAVNGVLLPGVTDVGTKPTVSQTGETICETYLLGWNGDLYGETVTVRFIKYLRPEIKFACKADLVAQIRADVDMVSQSGAEKERQI